MLADERFWQYGAESPIEDHMMIALGDVAGWKVIRKPYWKFEHATDFAHRRLPRRYVLLVPQCRVSRYRLDFAAFTKCDRGWLKTIGVECDGRQFHTSPEHIERDKKRDVEILRLTGMTVKRFTGSEIKKSAELCAAFVINELFEGQGWDFPDERAELVDSGEWWDLEDATDEA